MRGRQHGGEASGARVYELGAGSMEEKPVEPGCSEGQHGGRKTKYSKLHATIFWDILILM